MIRTAVSISAKGEWATAKEYFEVADGECAQYPIGEYFIRNIAKEEVLFYFCRGRKAASCAAAQHIIDRFGVSKIIVAGTCAGVDESFSLCDIIVPERAVQSDTMVKEAGQFFSEKYTIDIDLSKYGSKFKTGILASGDKPLVVRRDHLELRDHGVTVYDMEAAAIAYICALNGAECIIIKGISEFAKEDVLTGTEEAAREQYDEYVANTPVVMRNIFDKYLEMFL